MRFACCLPFLLQSCLLCGSLFLSVLFTSLIPSAIKAIPRIHFFFSLGFTSLLSIPALVLIFIEPEPRPSLGVLFSISLSKSVISPDWDSPARGTSPRLSPRGASQRYWWFTEASDLDLGVAKGFLGKHGVQFTVTISVARMSIYGITWDPNHHWEIEKCYGFKFFNLKMSFIMYYQIGNYLDFK